MPRRSHRRPSRPRHRSSLLLGEQLLELARLTRWSRADGLRRRPRAGLHEVTPRRTRILSHRVLEVGDHLLGLSRPGSSEPRCRPRADFRKSSSRRIGHVQEHEPDAVAGLEPLQLLQAGPATRALPSSRIETAASTSSSLKAIARPKSAQPSRVRDFFTRSPLMPSPQSLHGAWRRLNRVVQPSAGAARRTPGSAGARSEPQFKRRRFAACPPRADSLVLTGHAVLARTWPKSSRSRRPPLDFAVRRPRRARARCRSLARARQGWPSVAPATADSRAARQGFISASDRSPRPAPPRRRQKTPFPHALASACSSTADLEVCPASSQARKTSLTTTAASTCMHAHSHGGVGALSQQVRQPAPRAARAGWFRGWTRARGWSRPAPSSLLVPSRG